MSIAFVPSGAEFSMATRESSQDIIWRGLELTVIFDGGWSKSIHSTATGDDVTNSLQPQYQSAIYSAARTAAAKEFAEAA